MEDKNTCIFKSVNKIEKYVEYLLSQEKHQGQKIIHNHVLDKLEIIENESIAYKQNQESKKGWRPKPLSLVLSFAASISQEVFIAKALQKLHNWFKHISVIDKLALDEKDIETLTRSIPYVAHYKESNPHVHFLIPKLLPNKITNEKQYINLYTYRYSNPLYKLSGWGIKDKVINKQYEAKQKAKSPATYLKDKLYNEIENYRNLNDKLDKFILLIEKDLQKNHTDKALKKLEKIRKRNVR